MDRETISNLLAEVASGKLSPDEALENCAGSRLSRSATLLGWTIIARCGKACLSLFMAKASRRNNSP